MKIWTNEHHPALAGPWRDEPDKAQWVDEKTNLDCLIVRNRMGALCGYVGVPRTHKFYGHDYDSTPLESIHVHGSLTFASSCQEGAPEGQGVCHIPEPGRDGDVWWLGFDTAHAGDWAPSLRRFGGEIYRTFDYVRAQCAHLAEQLAAAAGACPMDMPT